MDLVQFLSCVKGQYTTRETQEFTSKYDPNYQLFLDIKIYVRSEAKKKKRRSPAGRLQRDPPLAPPARSSNRPEGVDCRGFATSSALFGSY